MEICIDIETLSTRKNAHILSIGAVAFDKDTNLVGLAGGDITLEIGVAGDGQNRHIDISTVEWWLKQDPRAVHRLSINRQFLMEALTNLSRFILQFEKPSIWANSPSFDCDILTDAYNDHGLARPWQFWQERDVRTAKQLGGEPTFEGTKHSALDDAVHEARIVQRYLNLKV